LVWFAAKRTINYLMTFLSFYKLILLLSKPNEREMELNADVKVGDIVRNNFKTARIFEANSIDFCCGGDISLKDACARSNGDVQTLLLQLEEVVVSGDPDSDFINTMEPDELCAYIEKRHHVYVREHIPFIEQKLQKLCEVHGEHHPELFEVKELFEGAASNLSMHMQKEEEVLFPYIRRLSLQKRKAKGPGKVSGGMLPTIGELEEEYQVERERFRKISSISSSYTPPSDACHTYQVTYEELREFEKDLHRHIHLENNILFVKARDLEQRF
jgi:regulator of cell morphogenesis and NO signaling